ncbi:MAG: hypothetical protein KGI69_03320 [Patescibacteria group bacterium]|nr:hypothetical protein [Patescibacteria group bacterium]
MNTKTLTPRALSVIDQYLHFKVGGAVCSVPYFNNKTVRARAALPVFVGKGSPKEIFDEMSAFLVKSHVSPDSVADDALKKLLVDNSIGIDCSAFAYYVLDAESREAGKKPLDRRLSPIRASGLLGRIAFKLNPAKNIDVATFANDKNSVVIRPEDSQPGDVITMMKDDGHDSRNHILVIHQVEYQNFAATKIHYSHAIAYPEDGLYGSGIRQGTIEIADPGKPLLDQAWTEDGKTGADSRIAARARESTTELRRLSAS